VNELLCAVGPALAMMPMDESSGPADRSSVSGTMSF